MQALQALGDAAARQPSASPVLHRDAQAMKRIEQSPPRWLQSRITSAVKEVVRVRRELRMARRLKDAMRLERELKQAQIEYAYSQHWVMLTYVGDQDETGWRYTRFLRRTRPLKGAFLCEGYLSSFY